jgi:hypothetical protein
VRATFTGLATETLWVTVRSDTENPLQNGSGIHTFWGSVGGSGVLGLSGSGGFEITGKAFSINSSPTKSCLDVNPPDLQLEVSLKQHNPCCDPFDTLLLLLCFFCLHLSQLCDGYLKPKKN